MKNIFTSIIFLFIVNFTYASIDAKVSYEKTEKGYKIVAYNNEYCPVSFKINFKTTNLKLKEVNNSIYVIPAQTKDFEVTNLDIISANKPYSISFSSIMNYGDAKLKLTTSTYIYDLPFKKGEEFIVWQGYNGSFSHQNESSLDFNMPTGTEIYAAREGIIVFVEQSNTKNCETKDCAKFNNYILVYHSDGTFASYVHIKKDGSVVKVGDTIDKNQLIGYSGNVGWSTTAHLHLVIYKQDLDKRITLKTKFLIGDGTKSEFLQEKKTYIKNY
jgi:murein DD-endopeptidase MepM/ murein hydrolase activator NlpD